MRVATFNTSRFQQFMKRYNHSEIIFEEGSIGNEMYVVHSGKVQLFRSPNGSEVPVAVVERGQFFGEMALVDSSPRSASARALVENTRLISLDKDKFLFLVSHQPAFALKLMHELCMKIRELSQKVYGAD